MSFFVANEPDEVVAHNHLRFINAAFSGGEHFFGAVRDQLRRFSWFLAKTSLIGLFVRSATFLLLDILSADWNPSVSGHNQSCLRDQRNERTPLREKSSNQLEAGRSSQSVVVRAHSLV